MDEQIYIRPEAWQEFEDIIERHINGGVYYFEKALRVFCKRHDWDFILQIENKREFHRRAQNILAFAGRRKYWLDRLDQVREGNAPFWIYRAGEKYCCPKHQDLEGIVLPPEHPFWQMYYPPNGWVCECNVYTGWLPGGIKRLGGKQEKPLPKWCNETDPETGLPPNIEPLFVGQTMPALFQYIEEIINGTDFIRPSFP